MQEKEGLVVGIIPDGNNTKWRNRTVASLGLSEVYRRGADLGLQLVKVAPTLGISRMVFYVLSQYDIKQRSAEKLESAIAGIEEFLVGARSLEGVQVSCYGSTVDSRIRRLRNLATNDPPGHVQVDVLLDYSAEWDLETRPIHTAGIPEMDLVIRSALKSPHHFRLSGFLPYQSNYAQLYGVEALWPDFTVEEFQEIIQNHRVFLATAKDRGSLVG
jgi:undecaprenyl diphosphate synthase